MDRQLEYDKGPAVDEQEDEVGSDDASTGGDDPGRDGLELVGSVVRSSKVGLGFGVGSFVAVYAICYQLVGAMFSAGLFAGGDQEPSRWVVTGLTMLGSQGATIMNGEEPIQMGFSVYGSLTSHVTALVPIVVLSIAGTFFVSSYVVLSVVLAEISTWIPEEEGTGTATGGARAEESEAIAVAVDSSLVLTTVGTVLSIALIGGVVAVFVYHLSGRTESPRSRTADSVQSESDEVSS